MGNIDLQLVRAICFDSSLSRKDSLGLVMDHLEEIGCKVREDVGDWFCIKFFSYLDDKEVRKVIQNMKKFYQEVIHEGREVILDSTFFSMSEDEKKRWCELWQTT